MWYIYFRHTEVYMYVIITGLQTIFPWSTCVEVFNSDHELKPFFSKTHTWNISIIQTLCISKLISASMSTKLLPTGLLYLGSSKWPWKILVSYLPFKENFTNVPVCWIGPVWLSMAIIRNKSEVVGSPARLIFWVSKQTSKVLLNGCHPLSRVVLDVF